MAELLQSGGWGDFLAWWRDKGQDRLFRLFVYKRMFTPYEQKGAFVDEMPYEDIFGKFIYIREVIKLGNGDYLLGVQERYDGKILNNLEYYRLSEIRLTYHPADMDEAEDFDEPLEV